MSPHAIAGWALLGYTTNAIVSSPSFFWSANLAFLLLKEESQAFISNEEDLQWLAGIIHDLAFLGSPLVGWMGYTEDENKMGCLIAVFIVFLSFSWFEYRLVQRIKQLEEQRNHRGTRTSQDLLLDHDCSGCLCRDRCLPPG